MRADWQKTEARGAGSGAAVAVPLVDWDTDDINELIAVLDPRDSPLGMAGVTITGRTLCFRVPPNADEAGMRERIDTLLEHASQAGAERRRKRPAFEQANDEAQRRSDEAAAALQERFRG